jgi:hypothetical protein
VNERGWGGRRTGAGRKFKYGEPTRPVRVPVSRVAAVQTYLESGIHSDTIEAVGAVVTRWREKAAGRETSPRWQNTSELLRELEAVLNGRQASQEATGAANAPDPMSLHPEG